MKSTMHRIPALLCGVTALVLSAGALANGQDRSTTDQSMQNSTPRSQTSTVGSNNSNAATTSTARNDSSSATAQTKFDQLDTNHDGSISKEEAQASNSLKAEFSRLDSNKDNKLSMTEFMSASNMASIKVDKTNKAKGY